MAQNYGQLGVVILGAGASARMGRPKLLLPWRDTTVIGELLVQWRKLNALQIAVVGRSHDEELVEELKREALKRSAPNTLQRSNASTHYIVNPQSERGMFSSIVCAAHWNGWRPDLSHWAIVLGDQPHLQPETLRQLLEFSAQNREAICQPTFGGHTRHPVILPRQVFLELKNTGATTLKEFLKLAAAPRVQCSMADAGLSLDMDTPEDYKRLRNSHQPV